ncbi:MAG TPA: NAD(P)H-dependent oxidoreductase [Candidatus Megaira endosymbiont of Nemacystus decipiens]|nr:NAD(P)H-dependent oxidoreductase [Candidatus Megaera endosymbiont of Nemacystus decipiens]
MKDNISNKHIIIFGSSRSHGNTRKIIDEITRDHSLPFIDLNDFEITPFDYEHRNKGDDFIPLIEKIVNYDTMIIATPVYWYQMSTQHKIFFDRFSDLLKIRKDLGRKLRGKNLFVISSFQSS